ncbi:hypothetical protein G7B40_037600 [Aetokthonos hydrillicola Thurmond2011]|jgi:hypothetical protein|uniref:Uncharacterized protein n=1 Tax=Aetokthonos hydrillicola Thurmond2011 TaxID=2712845 RepID=A0AAP5IET0_9CYAN|nr:hypothetical protein [Aetokthonos hydrillicola]MBO3461215.1 hypothetical protein [Aetokthonos hydrillicola CCALA 1050]MBW4589731.1 hypothetical protein [Aetokthonos hydrillicola CCALA 1050]MDR9900226.1 hypothetical protein [Aetokthonos hydrillicola Thurmond2011]
MADNSPDNQDISPDNQDISPDTIQNTVTNSENFAKIAISQLLQKYSIGRAQLYDRMKYLQITTYKESGKAYLYPDQIVHMDGLHEHIKETGRMDGYPVPDPSGPVEQVEQVQEESQPAGLVVAQTQQMAAPTYSAKGKRSQSKEQVDDVASIVRSAQGKAAGTLIAENLLARQFIENPDLLPEELRQKIKESGEMPMVDPFAYAESLLSFAQI